MLADEYHSTASGQEFSTVGKLDAKALPCISRNAILDVIENGLVEFAGRKELRSIKNEKGITNRLCKILNCQKLLYFHHEGMQDEEKGTSPSVDIEALATDAAFFEARLFAKEETLMAIEAKRLPSLPKLREREYLVGHEKPCGGIERFKLGIHGGNAFTWTMLGYVQEESFSAWREKINGWIDELSKNAKTKMTWHAAEKLKMIVEKQTTARHQSANGRYRNGNSDTIQINHLWVLLTDDRAVS